MNVTPMTIEEYIENAVDSFVNDPADTDFQRGYQQAMLNAQAFVKALDE